MVLLKFVESEVRGPSDLKHPSVTGFVLKRADSSIRHQKILMKSHLVLFAAAFMVSTFASADEPPNVVILLADDQGTLDANCYGSTDLETPNIDRLAKTGTRFTQAYAHTVCCPARAALLTGRHPQRSGVHHWAQGDMNGPDGINMALEEVTIAEALQSAGYRTALFGKWHLGAHRNFGPTKQGFDEFFGIRDGFIDNYNHFFLHGKGFHDLYEGTRKVEANGKYFPELMVQRAVDFIDENQDRPFFLYVPFNIPHYPEQPLRQYENQYREINEPARKSYAAMISTTDHYIGKVIDKLESNQLRNNTLIIYLSDNGHSEETEISIRVDNHNSGYPKGHSYGASGGGNTGKWIGHKSNFFEGGIRTPAVISFPTKLPESQVRDQIVTAMDWYPTILELCRIEPDANAPQLDGHSLVPIITSSSSESKHKRLHFQWGKKWAVREGDWKLVGSETNPQRSLHRLSGDNPEVVDHAKQQPDRVRYLESVHDAWAKDVQPNHEGINGLNR